MRVGSEFQAEIPDLSEFHNTTEASQGSGSILVWTPNPHLREDCKKIYTCTMYNVYYAFAYMYSIILVYMYIQYLWQFGMYAMEICNYMYVFLLGPAG